MLQTLAHENILELRLDRPPANALGPELIAALRDAIRSAPRNDAEALVLSGAPGMFTGGLDVPQLLELDRDGIRAAWESFFGLMHDLAACPVPVAAAITGHSPAGGAVLSLFCDWRVMAAGKFRIGLNEVQVGIPMPESIHRAARHVVGARQAERMCVGGLLLPVDEALRIGLLDEVLPVEQVVPRAVEWCRSLLALPRAAMSRTRHMARRELVAAVTAIDAATIDATVEDWFSDETQAALRALVARLAGKR